MTPPLDEAEIDAALRMLPDWRREDDRILRTVRVRGFTGPLLLANAIGHLAEAANHHPELRIAWGRLEISLTTHDANGLTAKDIGLARRINALLGVE